ncbi:MAG: oxygen-independent coproporphyrinogen III oxidase [Mariprofundales bacterium]
MTKPILPHDSDNANARTVVGDDPKFDLSILQKYDKAGPRYTSYPTAPMFHTGVDNEVCQQTLSKSGNKKAALSLYVHIPFCDTICYYCACNKIITRKRERAAEYMTYLLREIDMVADAMDCSRPVTQLHWGGGTPTYLDNDQILQLTNKLQQRFNFVADGEYSIETDPRECRPDTLEVLRKGGFNRLSVGVQDFDPRVQKAVNRLQSREETMFVLDEARRLGFESINIDLMYGLPLQTWESFDKTLEEIIACDPDRIALFNFAYLPHMFMPQRRIDPDDMPSPEVKLAILEHSVNKLLAAGYVFIGMDHFAKPNDELTIAQRQGLLYRNFQGYSTHADAEMVGLGVTSIGYIGDTFFQNNKKLEDYYAALDSNKLATMRGYQLTQEDLLRRWVIMRLMCDFALDFSAIENEFAINFREHFADGLEALSDMEDDGLLQIDASSLRVLPVGRLLIRNIAMVFDEYLMRKRDKVSYSRLI